MKEIMARYMQLRHVDSFHCTFPKDPPVPLKAPLQPPKLPTKDQAQLAIGNSSSSTQTHQAIDAAFQADGNDSSSISTPRTSDASDAQPAAHANAKITSNSTKPHGSSNPESSRSDERDAACGSGSSSSRLVDNADSNTALLSHGESSKANGSAATDGKQQLSVPVQGDMAEDMSLTGSVQQAGFEFGGDSLQFKVQCEHNVWFALPVANLHHTWVRLQHLDFWTVICQHAEAKL